MSNNNDDGRKVPEIVASLLEPGDGRTGLDGNKYIIKQNVDGHNYWAMTRRTGYRKMARAKPRAKPRATHKTKSKPKTKSKSKSKSRAATKRKVATKRKTPVKKAKTKSKHKTRTRSKAKAKRGVGSKTRSKPKKTKTKTKSKAKNISKGKSKSKSKRKAPKKSATVYKPGTRMKGLDGNMWKVVVDKRGVRRWQKYKTLSKN